MHLEHVALIVDDYDDAIRFYTGVLGFELIEDSPAETNDGRPKRWVVVRPPGASTGLLLARADGKRQASAVGDQFADGGDLRLHASHSWFSCSPRSAAERFPWTRESPSTQVSGLRVSRRAVNPWTHVRIVFEPVTSRNRRRAENTAVGVGLQLDDPTGTSLTALTCVGGQDHPKFRVPILDMACRIPP